MKYTLSQLREQALAARRSNDLLTAIRLYTAIVEHAPVDHISRINLADALVDAGAGDRAVRVYEATAKLCLHRGRPLLTIVACRAMEALAKRSDHILLELASCFGKGGTGQFRAVGRAEVPVVPVDDLVSDSELKRDETPEALFDRAQLAGTALDALVTLTPRFTPIPLLSELSPGKLVAVARMVVVHRVPAGHTIFKKGDAGHSCFLVARGTIEISGADGTDAGQPVAILSDGAIVGEMSLITGSPRSATARASEESDLIEVGVPALAAVDNELPNLAQALDRLAEKRWLNNLIRESPVFSSFNEDERVALLRHFQPHDVPEGTLLYSKDEEIKGLYLILRGEVACVDKDGQGNTRIVTQPGPGATLGIEAFSAAQTARFKATTLTPTTLLYLPADQVRRLMGAYPAFALALRSAVPYPSASPAL